MDFHILQTFVVRDVLASWKSAELFSNTCVFLLNMLNKEVILKAFIYQRKER